MKVLYKMMVVSSLSALVACGGEKPKESKVKSEKKTEVQSVEEEVEKEIIELKVAAIGETMAEIAFEPSSINVPANSKIKLTFENKSSTAGMLHNFVLVNLGTGQDIATAGIKAGQDNNFVPKDDRVIFYTKVLDLGESTEVEFDAPDKGSYHFICTFPGHYPSMIGRFNVQ